MSKEKKTQDIVNHKKYFFFGLVKLSDMKRIFEIGKELNIPIYGETWGCWPYVISKDDYSRIIHYLMEEKK